jgi:hypothetical protein
MARVWSSEAVGGVRQAPDDFSQVVGAGDDAADLVEVIGFGLVGLVGLVEQATDLLGKNHLGKRWRDSRRQENQQRQENGGEETQIRKLLSNRQLQGEA